MQAPTVPASAPLAPAERPYLAAPRVPQGLDVPVAVWSKRDLRATVTEGSTVSTWSGQVVFRDGRPGGHVGYELVGVECESVTPEGEPSEAARDAAERMLDGVAGEIGRAK